MLWTAWAVLLHCKEDSIAGCLRTSGGVRVGLTLSVVFLYCHLIKLAGLKGMMTLAFYAGVVLTAWQPLTAWHMFFTAGTFLGASTDLFYAGSSLFGFLCMACMFSMPIPCLVDRFKIIECAFVVLFAFGCLFSEFSMQ